MLQYDTNFVTEFPGQSFAVLPKVHINDSDTTMYTIPDRDEAERYRDTHLQTLISSPQPQSTPLNKT